MWVVRSKAELTSSSLVVGSSSFSINSSSLQYDRTSRSYGITALIFLSVSQFFYSFHPFFCLRLFLAESSIHFCVVTGGLSQVTERKWFVASLLLLSWDLQPTRSWFTKKQVFFLLTFKSQVLASFITIYYYCFAEFPLEYIILRWELAKEPQRERGANLRWTCSNFTHLLFHIFIAEKLFTSKIFTVGRQTISSHGSECSKAFPSFLFSSIYSLRYSDKVGAIQTFHSLTDTLTFLFKTFSLFGWSRFPLGCC